MLDWTPMAGTPSFQLSPDSPLAASIGTTWSLVPLRIPGGWAVHHNGIDARRLPSGHIEVNDSEDLFWAQKLPPPDSKVYSTDPSSPWRQIHVDAGWYRDRFRIVLLDPDWEHVRHSYETDAFEDFVRRLEEWLGAIVNGKEVRTGQLV